MIKNSKIIIVILTIMLFSGCLSQLSTDHILQKIKEKHENIKDFSATMVSIVSFGGKDIETKAKIMNKIPHKTSLQYLEPSDIEGNIINSDGAGVWYYDAKTKIISKETLKEEWNFQDYIESSSKLLDSNVTYEGMEKLNGRNVYRFKALPESEKYYIIFVDSESWLIVKIIAYEKDEKIASFEYNDIKLNTGIADTVFEKYKN